MVSSLVYKGMSSVPPPGLAVLLARQGWQVWKLFWLPLPGPVATWHVYTLLLSDCTREFDPPAACFGEAAHPSWPLSDNLMLGSVPICGLLSYNTPGKDSQKGYCIDYPLAASLGVRVR